MNKHEQLSLKGRAPGFHRHRVVLALHQRNLDFLDKELQERSTPGSAKYQQWMGFDEIGEYIANPAGAERVETWLRHNHIEIEKTTRRKEYIFAGAEISTWEAAFGFSFFMWIDEASQEEYYLADYCQIPESLSMDVVGLFNVCEPPPKVDSHSTKRISPLHPQRHRSLLRWDPNSPLSSASPSSSSSSLNEGLSSKPSSVTISYLNSFYQIESNIGNGALNQSVFETNNQFFSPSDLQVFQQQFGLTLQAAETIGGHAVPGTTHCSTSTSPTLFNCDEGNLDIQYIMGLAQRTNSIYWYVTGSDPFLTWATEAADQEHPPAVNSISWGGIEQVVPSADLNSFNAEALKLSLMGVTILVSSGDNGVANTGCACSGGGTPSPTKCSCSANSGSSVSSWTGTNSWAGVGYFPSFPATSPYVTAVGATMGGGGAPPSGGSQEIACQGNTGGIITTGGGFSTYSAMPSWQSDAVKAYFANLPSSSKPTSGYNPMGRGYPDVSFVGVAYEVIIANAIAYMYGTSCSAPVFGAFISLLNAKRLEQNLTSVGFINPTLYNASYNLFNDVVSGDNKCCLYTSPCCTAGFSATAGWDPVTGLGSVSFPNLAAIFNLSAPYNVVPSSNKNDLLSTTTLIIGGVVLAFVLCALICGCGYCMRYCWKTEKQSTTAHYEQQQQPSQAQRNRQPAVNNLRAADTTINNNPMLQNNSSLAQPLIVQPTTTQTVYDGGDGVTVVVNSTNPNYSAPQYLDSASSSYSVGGGGGASAPPAALSKSTYRSSHLQSQPPPLQSKSKPASLPSASISAPPRPVVVQDAAPTTMWECPDCTLLNEMDVIFCDACGQKQP